MAWYWPFGGSRDSGYTETITAAVDAAAKAGASPSPAATAAAEACAGMLARSLAAATVTPDTANTAAVTPAYLRRVGYDLIRQGEHLAVIDVRDGAPTLTSASTWTWWDGARPGSWRVQAQLPRPSHGSETVNVAGEAVVSLLWAENELQPWRGRGPLSGAALTASLLASSHRGLGAEARQPVGAVLPVPKADTGQVKDLERQLGRSGRLTLVETTSGGWESGRADAPRTDYVSRRMGADPPPAAVDLQDSAARQVIAACGLSPALLMGGTGAEAREDYRRYVTTVVQPLGRIIAAELARKLDTPALSLGFDALHAHDMAGRARAAATLVKAGWSPREAAAAVGLDPPASALPAGGSNPVEPMADGAAQV